MNELFIGKNEMEELGSPHTRERHPLKRACVFLQIYLVAVDQLICERRYMCFKMKFLGQI